MENMELFGMEFIDVITGLTGLTAMIAIFAVWTATTAYSPINKRLKRLDERKEALRSGILAPTQRTKQIKKTQSMGLMHSIVTKFKLLKSEQTEKTTQKLIQAGYRDNDALVIFMFARLVGPVLGLIAALTYIYGTNPFDGNSMKQAGLGIVIVFIGYYLPELYLKNVANKRKASISKALPDALDLMVICAEAGLTLDASLTRVSREMARQSEELADEVGLAGIELSFLPERRQALVNLTQRTGLKAIKSMVATLVQTEEFGTPLAHSLRILSNEFRNERMMKAEEKAARLPALMTVPLILFILPLLFIVLLGPAACGISDSIIGRFN